MPRYKIVQQYVMQDEWIIDAKEEELALEIAMTTNPQIESRIKTDWVEVEEVKNADRSKD
jgi:hypothetical protein|tara:strand:- start:264 stop:443 length:180 start_codon:yes stop_codon:yes gene_type:complete